MTYPRIYSLSTVGILKHYVHDYLFHPLRTDFVGPNGVGKSIIADLLQLLFIHDGSLIKFGTDGVKKEVRTVHKLPYNLNVAYCFINIEVHKDQFITIGVSISSQTNSRVVPFVIASSADTAGDFEQLYLRKNQLLFANDFIADGSVPDLKGLVSHLLNKSDLYVTAFRIKEEIKRYYQFLYDKQILHINLTIEENLKAFAKVIQSFSRAKSLDLSTGKASRSLKEFLFEENDDELMENYKKQQSNLEKLLKEYAELNAYIKDLGQKQKLLLQLKGLDHEQARAYRFFRIGEVAATEHKLRQLEYSEMNLQTGVRQQKQTRETLQRTIQKLPRINHLLTELHNKSSANNDLYRSYQDAFAQRETVDNELTELQLLNNIALQEGWLVQNEDFDVSVRSTQLFKDLIKLAKPYFSRYNGVKELDASYDSQRDEVSYLLTEIKTSVVQLGKLIEILQDTSADSVLGWALRNEQPLSEQQKSVILHFATLLTKRPASPSNGANYVDSEQLIKALTTKDGDEQGFWIELGPLKEFVFYEPDVDILNRTGKLSNSIESFLQKVRRDHAHLKAKEEELNKAAKGKPYNSNLFEQKFDLILMSYSNVEQIKEAAACMANLDKKLEEKAAERNGLTVAIDRIRAELPANIKYHEPEVVQRSLREIAGRNLSRVKRLSSYETTLGDQLKRAEEELETLTTRLHETTQDLLQAQREMDSLRKSLYDQFQENIQEDELNNYKISLETLRQNYLTAHGDYKLKYLEVLASFQETKNEANIAVNIEKTSGGYGFRVLEEALLGHKIRHTDDIAAALEDANRGRLQMADDLKSSMITVFDATISRYKHYKDLVHSVNNFFKGRKISGRYFFSIDFAKNQVLKIELVEDIGITIRTAARQGELPFDKPVDQIVEEFFKKAAHMKNKVPIEDLLNPKTYFDLSVSLMDENGTEIPGSTGETYSAIALLGIARLSIVQRNERQGIRFIILEELGSLDEQNFNTFPAIAKEFGYQIITMAPAPFRSNMADEWYAHHLIPGYEDQNINYNPSASYFKTKDRSEDLTLYLKQTKNELDRAEGVA